MNTSTAPVAFVTGGTGFVGSHLVERLVERGYRVRCLVRNRKKAEALSALPVELIDGDMFNTAALERGIAGADTVYHVAGVVASKKKEGFYLHNRDATINLIDAIRRINPSLRRFVYISSLAAVGPANQGVPVDETTPYRPITNYGRSKMEAEIAVRKAGDWLRSTIIRPPAVYGPRDVAFIDFFVSVKRGIVPLVGFSPKYLTLVHVADLVNGIVLAGENPAGVGQTYFLGGEGEYSWAGLGHITMDILGKRAFGIHIPPPLIFVVAGVAGCVAYVTGKPSVLSFEKGKDGVQEYWTCSFEKAKRELGYAPTVTVEEGVRQTIRWYQEKGWM